MLVMTPQYNHLNVAAETEIHQTRHYFFNLLQFGACVNSNLSFLFSANRSGAVFCCCLKVWRALHTSVVTGGYLSYYCLSININRSGHSALTSTPRELPLTGYFLFYRPFSINPRDGFWHNRTGTCGTNNHVTFKVTRITFFLHSDRFKHQQIVLRMWRCFNYS